MLVGDEHSAAELVVTVAQQGGHPGPFALVGRFPTNDPRGDPAIALAASLRPGRRRIFRRRLFRRRPSRYRSFRRRLSGSSRPRCGGLGDFNATYAHVTK